MFDRQAPEQYDTLNDVPEPVENPVLIAHEDARAQLAQARRSGKMHHALLLTGPRGIGKATLAFHFAQHLFNHPDPQNAPETMALPDPQSLPFRLARRGAHPGLLHLARPYNEQTKKFRTALTVDEVRRVGRFLTLTPADGGWRVVIIDPAEDMNTNAANALLKNLEEPPPRTLFILISHAPGRLLPTIRSRCSLMTLQGLDDHAIETILPMIGMEVPSDAHSRQLLIERAEGSVRNAILLTQFGGLEIEGMVDKVLNATNMPVPDAHKLADALAGKDSQVQFELYNRMILDRITRAAGRAGADNDLDRAMTLADVWQGLSQNIIEAETFNLDKKQHVLGSLRTLRAALSPTKA